MSLPSTLELARLEELRQAEMTALIADASARFADGSMSFASAGSWCNQACAVGLHGPVAEEDLDGFVEFYRQRGVEPRIEVCSMADVSLISGLARRGFRLVEFDHVYVCDLNDADIGSERPAPLTFETVDVEDEESFETLMSAALFDLPRSPVQDEVTKRVFDGPGTLALLARWEGAPAGGGFVQVMDSGLVLLFAAGVLEEYRRRGIQKALMVERLKLALERGGRFAVTHCAPGVATERNATRLGFRPAYTKAILTLSGPGLKVSS